MANIEHVFVLMLENRSFDHLLGWSNLHGVDPTGRPTTIRGLTGHEANVANGMSYNVGNNAPAQMAVDPSHEFNDVLLQLCGPTATYPRGGPYPPIDNSGFVYDYLYNAKAPPANAGEVMLGFTPTASPSLNKLAAEFSVCDSWFCSIPGPTFPNRFFALGASSAQLDHSPSATEIALWETVSGFRFEHGSIFDQSIDWRIYAGNVVFTLAHALKGIHLWSISRFKNFATDVQTPGYSAQFTWIEPNYGHVTSDYLGGNSEHPLDGIVGGDALIKATYEAIRNSPIWDSSLLIITWDEHGGFYDHVAPQPAPSPGDAAQFAGANWNDFRFDVYGPRVPAVIVSPWIPANTIDHRVYDHASIPATLERLFNLPAMTRRDAAALDLISLASLPQPRTNAPETIAVPEPMAAAHRDIPLDALHLPTPEATRPSEPIETDPNLPGFIYVASRADAELPEHGLEMALHTNFVQRRLRTMRTRAEARDYIEAVRAKVLRSKQ